MINTPTGVVTIDSIIAGKKEQEAKDAQEKLEKFKTGFVTDKKNSAIREQAISLGLKKEAIDDLKLIDRSSSTYTRLSHYYPRKG
jgi:hypothetical protein